MTIKKVSDGTTLLSYSNSNLMTIRYNNSFIRPKWGIYRSLNTPSDLRDEAIRFNSFSIGEVAEQTITFNALPTKVFGDIDFSPGATVNSSLTVSYSSSNPTVASIVDGKIHIVGVGTSTITAMQEGDLYHFVATSVDQTLTVISATAIEQKSSGKFDFRLYPNPVEDFITLDYSLKEKTVVNFDLYNLQGERVKALICSKWCDEGSYCDSFDCSDLIAGVYLGRIAAGNSMSTLKIVLSK